MARVSKVVASAPTTLARATFDFKRSYLEPGESGVWAVQQIRGKGFGVPALRQSFPARVGITLRYSQCEELAREVGRVYRSRTQREQFSELQADVVSAGPEIAEWAIGVLRVYSPESLSSVADRASAGLLPDFGVQTALDEALSDTEGGKWVLSSRRARMIKGWVSRPLSERESDWVSSRFNRLSQRPGEPPELLLDAMESGVRNDMLGRPLRLDLVRSIGWLSRNRAIRQRAFESLLSVASSRRSDSEMRLEAVGAIDRSYLPLTPETAEPLRKLAANEADPRVLRALNDMVSGAAAKRRAERLQR